MTRPLFYRADPKQVRDFHHRIFATADRVLLAERELVPLLYEVDRVRGYAKIGYKSLMGYCNHALRFSKTQSQRIVTSVRRYETLREFEQQKNSRRKDENGL